MHLHPTFAPANFYILNMALNGGDKIGIIKTICSFILLVALGGAFVIKGIDEIKFFIFSHLQEEDREEDTKD